MRSLLETGRSLQRQEPQEDSPVEASPRWSLLAVDSDGVEDDNGTIEMRSPTRISRAHDAAEFVGSSHSSSASVRRSAGAVGLSFVGVGLLLRAGVLPVATRTHSATVDDSGVSAGSLARLARGATSFVDIPTSAHPVAGAAVPWLMCSSVETCGDFQTQSWHTDPAELSSSVHAELEELPGVARGVVDTLRRRWAAAPPTFQGEEVTLRMVSDFMRQVLSRDPFRTGATMPFIDFRAGGGQKVLALSQLQVAFIAANVLMGNSIPAGDGLSAALRHCSDEGHSDSTMSLLSMLAVLSRELKEGAHGNMIIAATPAVDENGWMDRLKGATLTAPTICKEIGAGSSPSCGKPDFMSGGARGQALVDIAGGVIGGGGRLCNIANSQDESLVQFYSEVLALAFFAGAAGGDKMLPVPMLFLGTRRYLSSITGESSTTGGAQCGKIADKNWLNDRIVVEKLQVPWFGEELEISASAFVAAQSKSTAAIGDACATEELMNNNCDVQRRHLESDLSLWYGAFEPSLYAPFVQQAVAGAILSIGTGPWGAGVWFGDSQQYFLTVWLATSILSNAPGLDYYVYDHFCENPGNQCFVLGSKGCASCATSSGVGAIRLERCGPASLQDMIRELEGKPAVALYNALRSVGPPPEQVFDLMLLMAPRLGDMLQLPPKPTPLVGPPVEATPAPPTQAPASPQAGSQANGAHARQASVADAVRLAFTNCFAVALGISWLAVLGGTAWRMYTVNLAFKGHRSRNLFSFLADQDMRRGRPEGEE